jgi:hypothetical protein|tara:strand:+ start:320 stop:508 length:189 start_codon:yes stop_codon:yes gene_type:complete
MTYEDKKKLMQLYTLEVKDNLAMKTLLTEIIQILDYSYTKDIQDTGNAIGLIRSKVDQLLNK